MKAREMRELSGEELRHKIEEMSEELLHLRIQGSTGRLKNSARISLLRKDIARAKTVLRSGEGKGMSTSFGTKAL